ncbi:endoplasmic reticulum vesicle transporter-domain-containing protein [Hygrophoropsis aurantiaca]|uniref:Endoplasmic reticulum vesicle transporter-domain-containing protein n=1 Tax=Hygrophoropsis aurantiaca TaxID=72124 RepID=A0ACB8AE25_9AGAM|nr:endoplasmic reticulum vesicle transporter-domain-containing protein [Hygrophoropsis aurantiaca]
MAAQAQSSFFDKLDAAVPLANFDAFPKIPSSYKARSESRGFLTLFVAFIAFLLVLNDLGEYIWGWPDYEFSIDHLETSHMDVNVDMVVNMPCQYLSVDLRDVVGDRLYLSKGFQRDGRTCSRSFRSSGNITVQEVAWTILVLEYRPTFNHQSNGTACRIYGTLTVKKVTANLHITSLGHGYASNVHVPHDKMNMSHVITEFSFGPYFPDISQPLDYSFELASKPWMAYQYFLHVVPTVYVAPRSEPLRTNQYSVNHYMRTLNDHEGTPGIFFKFDLDPMVISIHQRTTSLVQLVIRCVGVIGGVFTCAAYFLRVTVRAVDAVSGADATPGIVAAEATGVRRKWTGGHLRARSNAQNPARVIRQGGGWVVEGSSSPYASYANTPVSGGFPPQSPFPSSPYLSPGPPGPPPSAPASFGGRPSHMRTSSLATPFPPPPQSPALAPPPLPGTPNEPRLSPSPPHAKKDD